MAAIAKQGEVSDQGPEQSYNKSVFGTNIPLATAKKKQEEELARQRIFNKAIESGATGEEAAAEVRRSGIGSVTPRLDQAAGAESQRQAGAEAASPESGDKYLRVKQLVRKFKGQAPLAETPEQFAAQLEASKGFGAESALLTGAGRARATESAIASGLSPAEAQSQINTAADVLRDARDKGKITKGLMESVTPDYGVGVFKSADKTAPKAAVPAPYAFQGPPESAKPKVGAPATTAGTTARTTEGVEKISGAPESGIGRSARILSTAQVAATRGFGAGATQAEKKAAELTKMASGRMVASEALDAVGEVALKGSADLTEAAKITKQQSLAADRMSKVAQGLTTPDEVASNADELKRLKQIVSQKVDPTAYVKNAELAKDKANLAYKAAKDAEAALEGTVMGLAGKSGDAAVDAAKITAQAGKAAKAGETLRKIAGSKLLKGVGKATRVLDLVTMGIEGYSLATDEDLRKQRVAELEEAAKGSDYLSAKGAAQGFFNPVGTLYATGALAGQALVSGANAREAEAGARKAEGVYNARLETRRKLISDEDFQKISQKERSAVMTSVRKANKYGPF